MQIGLLIAWVIVAAVLAGSLLHLLTRPNLRREQKALTLLVSVLISLPLGGLLLAAIFIFVLGPLWETGITDATALVILFGPLTVVVGIGIIVAGNVFDRRESCKVPHEIDG